MDQTQDASKTMKQHEFKTWPAFFQAVFDNIKTFEIRKNDRGVKVGDVLKLREFEEGKGYTGRQVFRKVTYITDFGQPDGQVVFGLRAPQFLGDAEDES